MVHKTELHLPLLLSDASECHACIERLTDLLESHEGIASAQCLETKADDTGQICIHYDPKNLTVGEVRELAHRAGIAVHERYGHILLRTETTHARRARTFATQVEQFPGVLEAAVAPAGVVRVEFDRTETDEAAIRRELQQRRIPIVERPIPVGHDHRCPSGHVHDHGGPFGEHSELVFAILAGCLLLVGWLLSITTSSPAWVPRVFYVATYFCAGYYTLREAFDSIRGGNFEVDSLMLVAAGGAAALGNWAEGGLLLFLFSIGHALEHYALGRARQAIEALAELTPATALVRRHDREEEVAVDELHAGDVMIVKPHARIAADGAVIAGNSSVDEAPITGESIPVDKWPLDDRPQRSSRFSHLSPHHRVFAGTINGRGALEVRVARPATESTLARVVTLVNEAETQKSPTQRFTDRFERIFVPSILVLVFMLLFAWVLLDEPFRDSFYRAMAVLVAASPCALAIATPSAVLSSVARAAHRGVLVKGGRPLEDLGTLTAIAFDKTGTLTTGKPQLTDVVAADGVSRVELLRVAVAAETISDHPLAAAVVRDGRQQLGSDSLPDAMDLQSIPGRGVEVRVEGDVVHIGKHDLFETVDGPRPPQAIRDVVEQLESQGRTTMIVRRGEKYLGVLGLMDPPRNSSASVIKRLRDLGHRTHDHDFGGQPAGCRRGGSPGGS